MAKYAVFVFPEYNRYGGAADFAGFCDTIEGVLPIVEARMRAGDEPGAQVGPFGGYNILDLEAGEEVDFPPVEDWVDDYMDARRARWDEEERVRRAKFIAEFPEQYAAASIHTASFAKLWNS